MNSDLVEEEIKREIKREEEDHKENLEKEASGEDFIQGRAKQIYMRGTI